LIDKGEQRNLDENEKTEHDNQYHSATAHAKIVVLSLYGRVFWSSEYNNTFPEGQY